MQFFKESELGFTAIEGQVFMLDKHFQPTVAVAYNFFPFFHDYLQLFFAIELLHIYNAFFFAVTSGYRENSTKKKENYYFVTS